MNIDDRETRYLENPQKASNNNATTHLQDRTATEFTLPSSFHTLDRD
jgi:hypothetical protein